MKKNFVKYLSITLAIASSLVSCQKDLNRKPTNSTTGDEAFTTALGYKQSLAKVYASFALTGSGGSSTSDLGGIDAGTSDFVRLYWSAQEWTTDEAICAWNDPDVPDFHNMSWSASNSLLNGLYNRCIYQVRVSSSFIAESTDSKLSARNITGTDLTNAKYYRAEARFLRAYAYWVLMDLFGNPPYIDENTPTGKFFPPQIARAKVYAYIESELKAIDPLLVAPKQNEYGRVDQAADWALLARMYLNAETYLGAGNGKYGDAITYASKVITSGYTLATNYRNLFLADNNLNNPETILSINYDGVNSQNFGGTTYIINASVNGAMTPALYGIPNGGWGGNRSTKMLPQLFADQSGNTDKRALFYGTKQDIDDVGTFTDGLAVVKFKNITSGGATAASSNGTFCSTDFPLFRLAEMYLVYAEAALRGGAGGNNTTALNYVNLLRTRAYGNTSGNLASISLSDVLNERGRELYWEGFRRTDLIRYGMFTGANYVWPWKGGVKAGKGVESFRALYPLPTSDITNNPNLIQNTGY